MGLLEGDSRDDSFNVFQDLLPSLVGKFRKTAIWKKDFSVDHLIQVQTYITRQASNQVWNSCVPAATLLPSLFELGRVNPTYANLIVIGKIPSGGSTLDNALASIVLNDIKNLGAHAKDLVCLSTNQSYSERRNDFEIQDTRIFSDKLRMVNGFGARYDLATSQTVFKGDVSNVTYRAFSNVEYKPTDSISLNAGSFYEKDNTTGSSFSPRLALNWHLDGSNTLRFIVSKATRMPDMFEQKADWAYPTSNYSTKVNGATSGYFYRSAISPGNLIGEKILSKEIGYLGNFETKGIIVDAKIFSDHMYDLISEKLQNSDFNPTNNSSNYLSGAEFQVTYQPNANYFIQAGYTHLNLHVTNIYEATQYAKDSGSLAISHRMNKDSNIAFAIYQYGATTSGQSSYGREDLTWSKSFRPGMSTVIIPSLTISHLDNTSSSFLDAINKVSTSTFNSHWQLYGGVKVIF